MSEQTETTKMTGGIEFTAADPTIPYRVVGAYEYVNALQNFQSLIESSTPDQIEVYNQVLETHPEFSYYAGMEIQGGVPANWKANSEDEQVQFESQFQKRGLAWMMALAKVEVGATLAAYTNTKRPFEQFGPTNFDANEFFALLLEDSLAHVKALTNEPVFKKVMKLRGSADSESIAYIRRLKLIRDMVEVLKKHGSPDVVAQVRDVDKKLEESQLALVAHLKATIAKTEQTVTSKRTVNGDVAAISDTACKALIDSIGK